MTFASLRDAWQDVASGGGLQWIGVSGDELPVAVVRLPAPFSALCATGVWSSFCVCDLSGQPQTHRSRSGGKN